MVHIFNYALIRLVPFAHRGDVLNVGLVVFKSDRLDVRLNASPQLLNYFNVSSRAVEWIATHLRDSDDSSTELDARVARLSKATGYTLSEIGWFTIDSDNQYEQRISDIISEYVEKPKSQTPKKKPGSKLSKDLRKIFKEYDLFSGDIQDIDRHRVVANLPVGPSGKLHIDFMLKNSKYHATETIDFTNSDHAGAAEIKNAALASVTFQHAKDTLANIGINCYLVFSATTLVERAVGPALKIAQREAIDSFNMESREDKARYLDIILNAAGHRSLLQS
ncbi:DUF3037 domain-containing protein [Mesorhizobium opportunistum]|uniref:DUF3037 domain-containing protein n=1 Tax=Mesorhizobium opportunistum TaxID=593909 RepID=UPI003338B69B